MGSPVCLPGFVSYAADAVGPRPRLVFVFVAFYPPSLQGKIGENDLSQLIDLLFNMTPNNNGEQRKVPGFGDYIWSYPSPTRRKLFTPVRKGSATSRPRKPLADNGLLTISPLITHNSSFNVTTRPLPCPERSKHSCARDGSPGTPGTPGTRICYCAHVDWSAVVCL